MAKTLQTMVALSPVCCCHHCTMSLVRCDTATTCVRVHKVGPPPVNKYTWRQLCFPRRTPTPFPHAKHTSTHETVLRLMSHKHCRRLCVSRCRPQRPYTLSCASSATHIEHFRPLTTPHIPPAASLTRRPHAISTTALTSYRRHIATHAIA